MTDEEFEAQQEQFRETVQRMFGDELPSVNEMMNVVFTWFPELATEVLMRAIAEES